MPPVSMKQVANFATGTTGVVETGGKFATGVDDTGGKFGTGVNNTGGKLPLASAKAAPDNGNNIRLVTCTMHTSGTWVKCYVHVKSWDGS